jgi:hypothetical protein
MLVDLGEVEWKVSNSISLIVQDKEYLVTRIQIVANGTQDLCGYVDDNGKISLVPLDNVPPGREFTLFFKDVALFVFNEPLPPRYQDNTLLIEINSEHEELIGEILFKYRNQAQVGSNYDAYLGKRY